MQQAPGCMSTSVQQCMQSLLRRTVNALRAERRVTPALRMLREGAGDDVTPFTDWLIEEPEAKFGGHGAAPGFVQFLHEVAADVHDYLVEQGAAS